MFDIFKVSEQSEGMSLKPKLYEAHVNDTLEETLIGTSDMVRLV